MLLGVVEKQLQNEVFQAEMERKLAQLLSEVSTRRRMWRRATVAAGNRVVQVPREAGGGGEEREQANTVPCFHAKEKILVEVDCYNKVATEWGSISVQLESRQIFPESSVRGRYRNGPYGEHSERMVLVDCHAIR